MLVRIDDTEEDIKDNDSLDKKWSWEVLERMTQSSLDRGVLNWRILYNDIVQP